MAIRQAPISMNTADLRSSGVTLQEAMRRGQQGNMTARQFDGLAATDQVDRFKGKRDDVFQLDAIWTRCIY